MVNASKIKILRNALKLSANAEQAQAAFRIHINNRINSGWHETTAVTLLLKVEYRYAELLTDLKALNCSTAEHLNSESDAFLASYQGYISAVQAAEEQLKSPSLPTIARANAIDPDVSINSVDASSASINRSLIAAPEHPQPSTTATTSRR